MPWVRFEPLGLSCEGVEDESVFDVGRRNGVPIATSCVGQASCGLCRVTVLAGAENLSACNAIERKHLGPRCLAAGERLSCQARVQGGDVAVAIARLRET